jgi:hypothetical protein
MIRIDVCTCMNAAVCVHSCSLDNLLMTDSRPMRNKQCQRIYWCKMRTCARIPECNTMHQIQRHTYTNTCVYVYSIRWAGLVDELSSSEQSLCGSAVLAAGCIAYCGSFAKATRTTLTQVPNNTGHMRCMHTWYSNGMSTCDTFRIRWVHAWCGDITA